MNCLIHACVPEVVAVVATRKTAELRTYLHGSPNHTIVDCEDDYYESLPRSSHSFLFLGQMSRLTIVAHRADIVATEHSAGSRIQDAAVEDKR